MDYAKILDYVRQPFWSFAAFLFCTIIFILPKTLTVQFGIDKIIDKYKPWIGLAWLFTLLVIIVILVPLAYKRVKEVTDERDLKKKRIEMLRTLSDSDKNILRGMVTGGTRSQQHDINDGDVQRLASYEVIYRSSQSGSQGFFDEMIATIYFDFTIQDWAYNYLRSHPELLDSPTSPADRISV